MTVNAYWLVRRHNMLAILLLISPLTIDLAFSQLRLAAAISMVLLVRRLDLRPLTLIAIIASFFIHSAMVLFAFMLLVSNAVGKSGHYLRNVASVRLFILITAGLVVSLLVSPLRYEILTILGDRRAIYENTSSTLAYSAFWIGLLFLFSREQPSWFDDSSNCFAYIVLALVGFNLILDGHTLRFLAASLPAILSGALSTTGTRRKVIFSLYPIYLALQWFYWSQT